MRVLTVVTEAPPIRSGIAAVIDRVTAGLEDLGHEVDLITTKDVGRRSIGEIRLTGLARHWGGLRRSMATYDAVHLHGPAPTFSDAFLALWRTVPRAHRPALVYTHHSEIELGGGTRALSAVYNGMHRRLVASARRVVVSTESYRSLAVGARTAVEVIPFGIDSLPRVVPPKAARFTVAFVGQLRPYKGVDVLLQAAAQLPDVRFEIAGTGHQEAALREMAAQLGLSNVTFHGAVTDAEREAILLRAHVICLPSLTRAEAFGIVLLEGMRSGCVPVASDLPGVRDVAGTTGLLARPGDPRSLIQALCLLRDDPDESERRQAASVAVAAGYRWDRTVHGYHRVISDAVLERRMEGATPLSVDQGLHLMRQAAISERASLLLLDGHGRSLQIAGVAGTPLPLHVVARGASLDGFAGQALHRMSPVVIETASGEVSSYVNQTKSGLCIPFEARDGSGYGVVSFSRVRDLTFDAREVRWLQSHVAEVARRAVPSRPADLITALEAVAA